MLCPDCLTSPNIVRQNDSIMNEHRGLEYEVSWFQCVILILSVYVLAALFAQMVFSLSPGVNTVLEFFDTLICLIFIGDFFHRLWVAPSRWQFLKWGWIDLVSSIPMVAWFRWGRIVRAVRIVRTLRAFRSTRVLIHFLFHKRAQSTFGVVSLITFLLIIFSSIIVLNFEPDKPGSNIKTPVDAIWWASMTVSTVGNSGLYPVSVEGRIMAVFLIIGGLGLFGTFTGYIAGLFLGAGQKKEEADLNALISEIRQLREKIEQLGKPR
jgi:voltage-gated potassium channel